jgi:hypothetical protein
MSTAWHYRMVNEGVWLFPPDPLLRVHPEARAPWAARVIRALTSSPLLIRTYTLDQSRLLAYLQASGQLVRPAPGGASPGGWVDVVCADDTLLPALLTSWGVTVPGWICVVPVALSDDWISLLDDRMQCISETIEHLPRADRLPDDQALVYAIDESIVIARPSPDAALAALARLAVTDGYLLVTEEYQE